MREAARVSFSEVVCGCELLRKRLVLRFCENRVHAVSSKKSTEANPIDICRCPSRTEKYFSCRMKEGPSVQSHSSTRILSWFVHSIEIPCIIYQYTKLINAAQKLLDLTSMFYRISFSWTLHALVAI